MRYNQVRFRFEGGPLHGQESWEMARRPYPVYYAYEHHWRPGIMKRVEYHLYRDDKGWVYRTDDLDIAHRRLIIATLP